MLSLAPTFLELRMSEPQGDLDTGSAFSPAALGHHRSEILAASGLGLTWQLQSCKGRRCLLPSRFYTDCLVQNFRPDWGAFSFLHLFFYSQGVCPCLGLEYVQATDVTLFLGVLAVFILWTYYEGHLLPRLMVNHCSPRLLFPFCAVRNHGFVFTSEMYMHPHRWYILN